MQPDSKPLLVAIAALGLAAVIAMAQEVNDLLRGRTR